MVIQGLFTILHQEKKNSYLLAIGTIGVLLSHLVIAMYLAIICAIYLVIHWKKVIQKSVIKALLLNLIFAIGITAFFLFPLLEQKQATQYEVFKPGRMQNMDGTNVIEKFKVYPSQFFYTKKGEMIYEIGAITIIGLLLTPFASKKINLNIKTDYYFYVLLGFIYLGMTITTFPFEKLPNILQMRCINIKLFNNSTTISI